MALTANERKDIGFSDYGVHFRRKFIMAKDKDIIDRKNVRKIQSSFAWVDHRLITGGFLEEVSTVGILLYLFLTAVSDRHGVSFYHDDRICRILKIDLSSLGQAREDLIHRSLIAYKYPIYQVLALPDKPVSPPSAQQVAEEKRKKALSYIQKIKQAAIGQRRS
jgi:hypothetical protein